MVAIDQVEPPLVFFSAQDCSSPTEKEMSPTDATPSSPVPLLNSARLYTTGRGFPDSVWAIHWNCQDPFMRSTSALDCTPI